MCNLIRILTQGGLIAKQHCPVGHFFFSLARVQETHEYRDVPFWQWVNLSVHCVEMKCMLLIPDAFGGADLALEP